MSRLRSIPSPACHRPAVIRSVIVVLAMIVAGACGGGSGARVLTPGPTAGQPTQVPTVPVAQRLSATGRISGQVVDSTTRQPIARARVLLSAAPEVMPHDRARLTDEAGRFEFTDLPVTETFEIQFSKTGYASIAYGEAPPDYESTRIALTEGQALDLLTIGLVPDVTVGGQVLDTDGTPLAGVLVQALRGEFADNVRTLVPVGDAMTDDRGQFRITALLPGQYYLGVRDPAFIGVGDATGPLMYPDTYFPGVNAPGDAERLTLDRTTPTPPVTIRLSLGTPQRVPLPPLDTPAAGTGEAPPPVAATGGISGRVISLTSQEPLVRARVVLTSVDNALPLPRATLTDADGRYQFGDLPPGRGYVVRVVKTGYAARGYGEGPPSRPPSAIVLEADQRLINVDVALATQVLISGTVLDEDKTAFAGALVEAMRPVFTNGRRTMVTVAEALTDDQGHFRLTSLPPGMYYVSAFDPVFADVGDAQGPLFYSPTLYPGGVFPDEATRITIDTGRAAEQLTFALKIIKPSRLTGSLTTRPSPEGVPRPLLSAAVIMSPQRNDQFSLFTVTEPSMEPNGGFVFANVPPGRYRIQARGETERDGVTLFQQFTLPIEGISQSIGQMLLSRGAVISGRVEWNSRTGVIPASRDGISVRAPMANGNTFGDALTGQLNADDTWAIRGVMAGDHFLRMEGLPPGWRLQSVDLAGRELTDIPYTFDYEEEVPGFRIVLTDRVTRVFGYVTPTQRQDPQSFAVVIFPSNPIYWTAGTRHVRLVYPDATGRYEVNDLPPGQYLAAAVLDVDPSDLGQPSVFDDLRSRREVKNFELGDRTIWRVDNLVPVTRGRQ